MKKLLKMLNFTSYIKYNYFFTKVNFDFSKLTSLVNFPLKHNSLALSLYNPETISVNSQLYLSIIG